MARSRGLGDVYKRQEIIYGVCTTHTTIQSFGQFFHSILLFPFLLHPFSTEILIKKMRVRHSNPTSNLF
jgi:hypothetical protein